MARMVHDIACRSLFCVQIVFEAARISPCTVAFRVPIYVISNDSSTFALKCEFSCPFPDAPGTGLSSNVFLAFEMRLLIFMPKCLGTMCSSLK